MVTLILIMTLLYMVTRVILTLTHYIVTKTALDFRRLKMVPHNIIKLQLPDGREVSLVQNSEGREGGVHGNAYQHTVEVLVDGEADIKGQLNLTELVHYLRYLDTSQELSDFVDASQYEI
tara:strand:+ start:148 stop:507 length:360 start_codon:yes stop_codon:yes gene_type:complete